MEDIITLAIIIAGWFALNKWVLPKLGVST